MENDKDFSCYLCLKFIPKDVNSLEHIIPECIGGRRKEYGLLCKTCNNGLASQIDKGMNEQLKKMYYNICLATNIKIDEDATVEVTDGNTLYKLDRNLRAQDEIILDLVTKDGVKRITLRGHNKEELCKKFDKKLLQLEKKYPNINREETLKGLKNLEEIKNIQNPIYFSNTNTLTSTFGDNDFFRSLTKIAINFYLWKGGDIYWIKEVIEIIKKANVFKKVAKFYYSTLKDLDLEKDEISHLIYIKGDPEMRILYAYIELFNVHNGIVLLNSDYTGEFFEEHYCYNFISKQEIVKNDIDIPIASSRLKFMDFFKIYMDNVSLKLHQQKYKTFKYRIYNILAEKGLVNF